MRNCLNFSARCLQIAFYLLLLYACDQRVESTQQRISAENNKSADIVFHADGRFEIENNVVLLGDPISSWINAFGEPTRLERRRIYIWDTLGMKVFTDHSGHITLATSSGDKTTSFSLHFVHWPSYDPVLGDSDNPGALPLNKFEGVFEYGGIQIDSSTSIKEFITTNKLKDSVSRPHDYRRIIDVQERLISFSISPKGTEDEPYNPKSLDISLLN